jgi:hypothetical protein
MQDFKTRKQKNSFHVVVYSALFNNGIEALNLILEKCVAEILLDLRYNLASLHHRVLHRVLAWLAIGDLIVSYELQMLRQLTVACISAFLLKPYAVWQALLNFHNFAKHSPPHLS